MISGISNNNNSELNQGAKLTLFEKILTTFFVIIVLWLPSIITYSFSLFMCTEIEEEVGVFS